MITKCLFLSNQPCMTQPTLSVYILMDTLKDCVTNYLQLNKSSGSCNALNGLSNKVCVPSKTEDSNLGVFNMITGINESKKFKKRIS